MLKFYLFAMVMLLSLNVLAKHQKHHKHRRHHHVAYHGPKKLPQTGMASFYGDRVNHHRVACGERYCKDSFMAAHRWLPFGTYVKVTNLKNQKSAIVRITDRGPYRKGRIIDVSGITATYLGFRGSGVARVQITTPNDSEFKFFRDHVMDSINKILNKSDAKEETSDSTISIIAASFKSKSNAKNLQHYLKLKHIKNVNIRAKRHKRRLVYKVVINDVAKNDIKGILRILRKKHLKGVVIYP